MQTGLRLNRDGTERLEYVEHGLPVRAVDGKLSYFQQYAAACHWHYDFEWLQASEGEMDYFVNGEIVHIGEGQAIFVNSCRLHYGFSAAREECVFRTFLFHPSLLGEMPLPTAAYTARLAADGQRDWYLLDPARDSAMLREMDVIFDRCAAKPELFEFDVQAACGRLIVLTYQALSPDAAAEPVNDPAWAELRLMTGFLQEHYGEKVTLQAVANAGSVCRSKCCRLFRERLGTTPLGYVTSYRLEKACMLLARGVSVTETAQQCGFEGASYFAETFRKQYGTSPAAYRRRVQA